MLVCVIGAVMVRGLVRGEITCEADLGALVRQAVAWFVRENTDRVIRRLDVKVLDLFVREEPLDALDGWAEEDAARGRCTSSGAGKALTTFVSYIKIPLLYFAEITLWRLCQFPWRWRICGYRRMRLLPTLRQRLPILRRRLPTLQLRLGRWSLTRRPLTSLQLR